MNMSNSESRKREAELAAGSGAEAPEARRGPFCPACNHLEAAHGTKRKMCLACERPLNGPPGEPCPLTINGAIRFDCAGCGAVAHDLGGDETLGWVWDEDGAEVFCPGCVNNAPAPVQPPAPDPDEDRREVAFQKHRHAELASDPDETCDHGCIPNHCAICNDSAPDPDETNHAPSPVCSPETCGQEPCAPVPPATTGGTDEAEALAAVLYETITHCEWVLAAPRSRSLWTLRAEAVLPWLRDRDLARDARTRANALQEAADHLEGSEDPERPGDYLIRRTWAADELRGRADQAGGAS